MPLLLLIPIAMYGIWRLWLRLRGQTWKPEGKWESRTTAMHDYLAAQPPLSRSEKIYRVITVVVTCSLAALFVFIVLRAD